MSNNRYARDPFRVALETTWMSGMLVLVCALFAIFPDAIWLDHRFWSFWSVYWIYATFVVGVLIFVHSNIAVLKYVLYRSGHTLQGQGVVMRRVRWATTALAAIGIIMILSQAAMTPIGNDWVTALGLYALAFSFILITIVIYEIRRLN